MLKEIHKYLLWFFAVLIAVTIAGFLVWIDPSYKQSVKEVKEGHVYSKAVMQDQRMTAEDYESLQNLPKVMVKRFQSDPYSHKLRVNGKASPVRNEVVYASVMIDVVAINVRVGDMVKKDDVLVELGSEASEQKIKAAQLGLEAAIINYQTTKELHEQGLASLISLLQAEMKLRDVRSDLRRLLDSSKYVLAPMDGVVNAIYIQPGQTVLPKDRLVHISDASSLIVTSYVSAKDLRWIDEYATVVIDDYVSEKTNNRVVGISHVADMNTGTFRVDVEVTGSSRNLFSSYVDVLFIGQSIQAHKIQAKLIVFDENDEPGVYILTDDDIAQFVPIEILVNDFEGLWVLGLPDDVMLIVDNIDQVISGERVHVVSEEKVDSDEKAKPDKK